MEDAFGGDFDGFTDPASGETSEDPIYFWIDTEDQGSLFHIACPFTNPDYTRSVLFADGSAKNIPEDDYLKQSARQEIVGEIGQIPLLRALAEY